MATIKTPRDNADRGAVSTIVAALAAPFDPSEVKFKPAVVSGNRAMALGYVDARVVQDRLDEVLGVIGWQDDYQVQPDGSVICRLKVRLGDEWITKMDVGGQSEQPDGGDRLKAAFSDALKRAAVKFGVGRYLYRLPSQWVDYDPHKRTFARPPALPAWARPTRPAAEEKPAPKLASHTLPADGAELKRRLQDFEGRLVGQGLCRKGELVDHVVQEGVKAGRPADPAEWSGEAIGWAVDEAKAFAARTRAKGGRKKEVA
jgi:hypothetical protein